MTVICPTVTAKTSREYLTQLLRIQPFAQRIHFDFMDGIFAPVHSVSLDDAWWQPGPVVDLHVMYEHPMEYIETLIALQPHMIIIHAEAEDVGAFLQELEGLGIRRGLALLQDTPPTIIEQYLPLLDHVLIFSGDLGHFGGKADLNLLHKVQWLKKQKPHLEIGWDGGINTKNASTLVAGGIDVLNVGGTIQKAKDPEKAYDTLISAISGEGL